MNKNIIYGSLVIIWIVCLIASLAFKFYLGVILLAVPVAAFCGWAQSKSDIDRYESARDQVKEKGIDWAIKELTVNPNMSKIWAEGLRKGIKDLDRP